MLWGRLFTQDSDEERRARLDGNVVEVSAGGIFLASAIQILSENLGFVKSAERSTGLWGDGSAVPLMSYGLIEYLMGVDLSRFEMLELGGGSSTGFWAARVKSVVTLETDLSLVEKMRKTLPANVTPIQTAPENMPRRMTALDAKFDLIAIDPAANRYACTKVAIPMLRPCGFIILDNSEWYPNSCALLREADLIQVDFPDFRPAHHYRAVTSLFLHRDFRSRPKAGPMPAVPVGGKNAEPTPWDRDPG